MSFGNTIKKYTKMAGEANSPTAFMYGEVVGILPLKIKIDGRFLLPEDFLTTTNTTKSLQLGDKVVLLRNQGGEDYLVLDRM